MNLSSLFCYPHYPHKFIVIHNVQNPQKSTLFIERKKSKKIWWKKLSTQKNRKNVEKWGFPQSYPRYPHPKWEKRGITRG